MVENKKYIEKEGLNKLIDFESSINSDLGVFDTESGKLEKPITPNANDLVRIHKLIRQRKCFTILEFGIGYSTLIIADALKKNQDDWKKLPNIPEIRNRFMFKSFSVDASKKWIETTKKRFPPYLIDYVNFHYSPVEIGTFNGQLCHYYKNLPDIVPDFIYLDGPSPNDVEGNINGLSFKCDERTVMSGDLLLMESTFLPGTFILIDGRTNNARFLENNFKRKYNTIWDKEGDITSFELKEERLGKYNLLGSDFFR